MRERIYGWICYIARINHRDDFVAKYLKIKNKEYQTGYKEFTKTINTLIRLLMESYLALMLISIEKGYSRINDNKNFREPACEGPEQGSKVLY